MSGKLVLPSVTRLRTGNRNQILFSLDSYADMVWNRVRYWENDRGIDRYRLQISPPYKPRTTGKESQNTKYRGLLRDIMDWSGESMSRINQEMKHYMDDNDPEGFPKTKGVAGYVDYLSESELDTRTMSRLIEWTIRFMTDIDVPIQHHWDGMYDD